MSRNVDYITAIELDPLTLEVVSSRRATFPATENDARWQNGRPAIPPSHVPETYPPDEPNYLPFLGPLGDQRSSMGCLLSFGRPVYMTPDTSPGVQPAQAWWGSIGTGETTAYIEELPQDNYGVGTGHEGVYYTQDGYAVSIDRRPYQGDAILFWTTNPEPKAPDDTAVPLASYKQGFFA